MKFNLDVRCKLNIMSCRFPVPLNKHMNSKHTHCASSIVQLSMLILKVHTCLSQKYLRPVDTTLCSLITKVGLYYLSTLLTNLLHTNKSCILVTELVDSLLFIFIKPSTQF